MRPAAQMAMPRDRAGAPSVRLEAVPAPDALRAWAHDAESVSEALARDWTALAGEASEPNSFAEYWFVAASLRPMGEGRDLRLIEVRRGASLVGVLPVAVELFYGRTRVRFLQNWCHHQMFLGTPLVRAGEEAAFWSAVLDLLDEAGWAPNLLHVRGLVDGGSVHRGLIAAAAARRRSCATVHRETRALLASDLDAAAYYERTVRPKKRKEIRRLQHRLAELGSVETRRLERADEVEAWCDAFLVLERAGWKGEKGTALSCSPQAEAFFRASIAGAHAAGRLHFLRLDLDGRPIAMLASFLASPGSFSFKTSFDEAFARFSPGVLIQLENLKILERPGIEWMDSCAAENHPMIDGLWTGRRRIVRVTVRLRGWRRSLVFLVCRVLESGSAAIRRFAGRGMA